MKQPKQVISTEKQLKSVRISIVEISDNKNVPLAYYLYVNGKLQTEWTFDELNDFSNTLPTDCLNEFCLDDLVPEEEKDFF